MIWLFFTWTLRCSEWSRPLITLTSFRTETWTRLSPWILFYYLHLELVNNFTPSRLHTFTHTFTHTFILTFTHTFTHTFTISQNLCSHVHKISININANSLPDQTSFRWNAWITGIDASLRTHMKIFLFL